MNLLIAVFGMLAVLVSIGVKLALALRPRTPQAAPADDADDLVWLRAGALSDTLSRSRREQATPRHVPARRLRRGAPDCVLPGQGLAARTRMRAGADIDGPAA